MKKHLLILILLLLPFGLMAQTSSKIKSLEKQRKEALAEIEVTNKLLSETKKTTTNLLGRLNLLVERINSRRKVITILNQEVEALNKDLQEKETNIRTLERELKLKRGNYAQSLQKMQTNRKAQGQLLFVLSAENFSQSYRRLRYLKEYATYQKVQAQDIIQKQEELKKEKESLEQGKQEKLALLQDKEKENQLLQDEEKTKQTEVSGLKKKEKTLQSQLSQKQKQAQALNKQIEKAIAEEIERAEKAARKAEEARLAAEKKAKEKAKESGTTATQPVQPATPAAPERVAETAGGYAMTKEERKLSTNFANNKGSLPFPIKGRYKIIGRFGQQKHQELKYVTTNNNGIDIQTSPNNEACAVFNGEVTSVFVVPGYNNSVIIRHGNYLTVYANLQSVYVKTGTKVTTGQAIGKIFTDAEEGNITILHFELWKEKVKLNPEAWLNK